MSNKKIAIFVTEGETDKIFYEKLLGVLRNKTPNKRFSFLKIKIISIDGFGKFESKLTSKFKKIVKENRKIEKNIEFYVFLCYDNDIFIGRKNPPINPAVIEKNLRKAGAIEIFHIVADKCIEDFFLIDFGGICKFLNLKDERRNSYKSLAGLKKLYKKAGKAYIKGAKSETLLDHLDFELIEKELCGKFNEFCKISGVDCKVVKK